MAEPPSAPAGDTDLEQRLRAALADRYGLLGTIGHGGMASVYRARDLRHDVTVAIKVLRPELVLASGIPRFQREVQIAATLQHPNILPLRDSGVAAGLPYLVMPFVEGESLQQRLQRETRLPVDEAVRLACEVASGLAHAHAKGFIHRDIKPGNILLSHGHAMLADFGVARAIRQGSGDRITDSGVAVGTVAYMAPEQSAGEGVDERADLYALGCVLYEMLAGTPPFTGSSAQSIMARHAVDPVPSVRTVRRGVPAAMQAVIERALAKVPQDRYATADEFREALQRAALEPATATDLTALASGEPAVRASEAGQPAGARSSTSEEVRPTWWRRPVALVGVAAIAAAAIVGGARLLRAPAALDAGRVMVMPLTLSEGWTGSRSAGEDAATLIGSAMDGAGGLRWVDGWQQLDADDRDDPRRVTLRTTLRIARRLRCAYVITGKLVGRGDSADVFLELHDVAGDSLLLRTVGAPASGADSWRGALPAVTALLPPILRTNPPDVETAWRARPPQAVANFLRAEAALRRVQLPDALAAYREAVRTDSTFALAAIRGAQAASWNHRQSEAQALVGLALQQPLPPQHERFARGMTAYFDGSADSAIARLHEAIALDSGMVAAWAQLGETYMHLLPTAGRTDSLAEVAYTAARRIDSSAATLQFHLVEILRRRGAVAEARALAERFAAVAADSELVREVRLIADCDADGRLLGDLSRLVRDQPLPLVVAAKSLAGSPITAPCARSAYAALLREDTAATSEADARRFSALLGTVGLQVAARQSEAAAATIEAFIARWSSGSSVYLLAAPVLPELAAAARRVARQDSSTYGGDYAGVPYPVRRWELGVWAAHEGRTGTADAVARQLAARAVTGSRSDSLLAVSMRGHAALARGDTSAAIEAFERLLAAPAVVADLAWYEDAPHGFDRLVLGRLLLARREAARALTLLDVHDAAMPLIHPLYQRASLEARLAAATLLRQQSVVQSLRARLARWSSS